MARQNSGARSRLRIERERRGLTQREIAERAGVHQPTYSLWESGEVVPVAHNIQRLARAFETSDGEVFAWVMEDAE